MLFLAIKQMLARKRQTLLTLFAVVLGSAGYVIFSGLQLGAQENMQNMLIESNGHVSISVKDDYITADSVKGIFFNGGTVQWINEPSGRRAHTALSSPNRWYRILEMDSRVQAFAPLLTDTAIAGNAGFTDDVSVQGIDIERHLRTTNLADFVTSGDLRELAHSNASAFTGEHLLKRLGARKGDTISLVTANGETHPVKIVGTIKTGNRRTDEGTVYTSITTLQQMLGRPGTVDKIIIRLKKLDDAEIFSTELAASTQDKVESWQQASANFMSMMKTQNIVRQITLFTLIMVIAFGIYNILNMVVTHKQKEIAILRSIGFNQHDTEKIFLLQGIITGVTGSLLGLIVGWRVNLFVETIPIPVGKGHMSVSWDPMIYLYAFLILTGSALLASYFPARAAGRLSPIDIIRGAQ